MSVLRVLMNITAPGHHHHQFEGYEGLARLPRLCKVLQGSLSVVHQALTTLPKPAIGYYGAAKPNANAMEFFETPGFFNPYYEVLIRFSIMHPGNHLQPSC